MAPEYLYLPLSTRIKNVEKCGFAFCALISYSSSKSIMHKKLQALVDERCFLSRFDGKA